MRNPFRTWVDDKVTLSDYQRTGIQDAGSACDADSFDLESGGTVDEIVSRLVDTPEFKEQWLEQNRDDVEANGLDPEEAYRWWLDGWRYVARKVVAGELEAMRERARDNPGRASRRPRVAAAPPRSFHLRRLRRPQETVCGQPPTAHDVTHDKVSDLVEREGHSTASLDDLCDACRKKAL